MRSVSSLAENRVVLGNISWATYLALVEDAQNPRGRLAYDQGVLEIMSPSGLHESIKTRIARMIETFTLECKIEIRGVGSTTFKRNDLEKGIEADECYYIQNEEAVHGVDEIDLAVHPPPDLAVEIDISRSSTMKLRIYAALRVPEVWRYDGEMIRVHRLHEGDYVETPHSELLPRFPISKAIELLQRSTAIGENELIREFQAWIRQHGRDPTPKQ